MILMTFDLVVVSAGEAVVEVMSTHSDGMGGDPSPPLPPCFQLKDPASSQAVALARSMAQKGEYGASSHELWNHNPVSRWSVHIATLLAAAQGSARRATCRS